MKLVGVEILAAEIDVNSGTNGVSSEIRQQGKNMNMQFIREKQLANGLTLSFYDCSKQLVTDRWFVKMRGELKLPVADAVLPEGDGNDPELVAMVQERLGDSVALYLDRERNFVDAEEKDAVILMLIDQIEENLVGYLADPSFPQKLFDRQYQKMRTQCEIELQQRQAVVDDEEEGPADFSACFRD